jgi:hypothetical protein
VTRTSSRGEWLFGAIPHASGRYVLRGVCMALSLGMGRGTGFGYHQAWERPGEVYRIRITTVLRRDA